MTVFRALVVIVPTALIACAQAVSQDLIDDEEGGSHAVAGVSSGGKATASGGKAGNTASAGKPAGGSGTQAFGGSATSGGNSNEGGEDSGGTGGSTSAGSGGKASGGTGGSGGNAGAGGSSGSSGSGGSGTVGSGSCSDTPLFVVGPGTKYAKDAKVAAVCTGGTPCTLAQPALQNGKQYEFNCLDEYNCGTQNPGTTNWAQPPWAVTKACDE